MTKKERLENALKLWGQECEGVGWNNARKVYGSRDNKTYRDGFEDGRIRGAKDMQNAFEKDLCERERKGYKLGYDLGHTDGYDTGHTKGLWAGQCVAGDLTKQLTKALEGEAQAYKRGERKGYDDGHKDGYYKGRATMKTQIEEMLLDESL